MADTMTCPLCGQQHPAGSTWCKNQWAEIPAPETTADRAAPPPGIPDEPVQQVACPNCGDHGPAGGDCRQCGATLPSGAGGRPRAGVLLLPSGRRVVLPPNVEVAIGRESELSEVRTDLEAFDAVSRRHCFVTFDPASNSVIVRDPDSLNRTWVGDDPRMLRPDESRRSALPVRLRLGLHLLLTISEGETT